MKYKKFTAAALTLCMAASFLSGCGSSEKEKEGEDDTYNIVMSYVTLGTEPEDLDEVESALSDLAMEKIGCTVTLKPVAMANMASQYNLWASSGEQVDLYMMWNMDISDYVNKGSILELEDYVQYAPQIEAVNEERDIFKGGLYGDKLYAIPIVNPSIGEGKAIYARKDILEAVGYEQKDLYTYEDLDEIFEKIKSKYPDMITCAWAGTRTITYANYWIPYDDMGVSGGLAGVLMEPTSGNTTIENLYASKEYREYIGWMKKWYDAGYISNDAATTSDQPTDWVKAGRSAGFEYGDDTPGNQENKEAQTGYEMVQLNIKPTYVMTTTYSQLRWCIGANSGQPEKAMEFLNMFYDGEDAINVITNGLEEKHYVKTEGSKIISYPEGVDGTNTPYNNVLGLYGDKRNLYMFAPNTDDFYERSDTYTENALEKKSTALGYTFDSSDYQTELAAVTSVINKYLATLEYGMASDLDTAYNEFLDSLDKAGMNKLIEANQKQFDEWLTNQE